MARLHHLEWETRAECLEAIASAYGERAPKGTVPAWWTAFEKWYQEQKETAKDGIVSMTLKTEAGFYEDEGGDEDEEEEEAQEEDDEEVEDGDDPPDSE